LNINQSSAESADIQLYEAGFHPRWIIELDGGFNTVGEDNSIPYAELPDLVTPTTPGQTPGLFVSVEDRTDVIFFSVSAIIFMRGYLSPIQQAP